MGTELQYVLNLAALLKRNVDTLNPEGDIGESWAYSRERFSKENITTGFDWLQESMDRMLEQYNRESVRKMMLKQEKIFKEQVKELHRLYIVQKMLMGELKSNREIQHASLTNAVPDTIHLGPDCRVADARTGYWSTATSSQTSHSPYSRTNHPAPHMSFDYKFHQSFDVKSEPSSNEPSSCSRYACRTQRGFDLEQAVGEGNSTEFSVREDPTSSFKRVSKDKMAIDGSQDLCLCTDEDSDIELTLSIGRSTDKKKMKHRPHSNIELGSSKSTPNETRQLISSTSVRLDQEEEMSDASATNFSQESLKRPHWLFQNLRLNRT